MRETADHNSTDEGPPRSVARSCGGCDSSSCCCWCTREPLDIGRFRFANSVEAELDRQSQAAGSEAAACLSSASRSAAAATAAAAAAAEEANPAPTDEFHECVDASSFSSQAASAAAATVQREAQEAKAASRAAGKTTRGKEKKDKSSWGGPLWPVFDVRLQARRTDASGQPPAPVSILQIENTVLKKYHRDRATEYVSPGSSLVSV
ncbi:hypothetical protein Emed_005562 [Eimeria media]